MIGSITEINWLGVVLALIAYSVLGGIWFTVLFKKQYMFSLGRENDKAQNMASIFIIGPALCSLVITITSAVLMAALKIDSYSAALEFSLIVGIGYLFANTVNIAINPNIPRPILYGMISGVFHLVGMVIVGSVLVLSSAF